MIGYNIEVLRQTASLVVNPIKVNNFAVTARWKVAPQTERRCHPKPNLRITWTVGI